MVTRNELEAWLNGYMNPGSGSIVDFIPNGLQVEGRDRIDAVVTAVSINLEVIRAAVREEAGAIVVHHGLFWKNDEPTIRGYRRERFKLLLGHDISLFTYHLPLDVHPEIGHNRLILEGIGCRVVEEDEEGKSIGLRGRFDPAIAFEELIERIDGLLGSEARYFRHGGDLIESVFVVSGGGRNELEDVLTKDVDAYITGDAKESTAYVVRESAMNYIYAGHYHTEKLGIAALGQRIEREFDVRVRFIDVENRL
jgi:dinuclear metal center YbgI/SA1388 family protein